MEKNEILRKLEKSAIKYKENLQNKNLLIMYYENEKINYIETLFLARNFMHLTGVRLADKNKKYKKANQFYNCCVNQKLSYKDIVIKKDGTTKLKLDIIEELTNIDKKCKMIGIYNNSKKELLTEILLGNIHMCLGMIKDLKMYYIPNSLLKTDIRKLIIKPYKVIGILKKEKCDKKYRNITYINKNIRIREIQKNIDLYNKIDIEVLKNI